jgi:hypothetical protein
MDLQIVPKVLKELMSVGFPPSKKMRSLDLNILIITNGKSNNVHDSEHSDFIAVSSSKKKVYFSLVHSVYFKCHPVLHMQVSVGIRKCFVLKNM